MARTSAELTAEEIIVIEDLAAVPNNTVIYKNNTGDVTGVALGASGTALVSQGATSAPTFSAVATGNVIGPATNTADFIPQWNGANSKTLKDGKAAPTGAIVGTTDTQTLTNKDLTSGTNIFPTFNQNTTGSAATLTTPRTIGGVSFNGSANITVASATGGFTVSGGDLALGANNITMTGSIGSTGSRVTKGWFTDLQVTNAISGSITGNAATATALATARAIYGNNFDGTAALTQIIASTYGGTGNGFTKFSGPTTSEKTKTLRDANDTILELGGSYTPTGTRTSLTMVTPVLGTPASGNLANCTFPTLNQNTTGSAASLSISGQTGLLTFTGLASTNRAKTVRDAADTILELGGSYTPTGTWTSLTMVTPVLGTPTSGNLTNCTADGTTKVGFLSVPSNSQSAAYTTVLADSGKSIDHPSTDANARTFTIDSNANVAYPVGTCISFSNMTSNNVTIAITSDTMYLAGTGSTGSRTLAQYGVATARKLTSTTWIIFGTGLT